MMRLPFPGPAASGLLIAATLIVCGCDSPRPAIATPPVTDGENPSEVSTYLYLILPAERTPLLSSYEQAAMMAAGNSQAILRMEKPEENAPPSQQVELIRKAIADGATAILIVAQDPEAVAPALVEAREKGISVVLLDRPVPVEGTPLTLITQPPLVESARKMVDQVIKAVGEFKLSADAPAVLVVHRQPDDPDLAARTLALREALKAAGVTEIMEFSFQEPGAESKTFYEQAVGREPTVSMILANDDDALAAVAVPRADSVRDGGVPRMIGGMVSQPRNLDLVSFNQVAGLVNMNVQELMDRAVQVAIGQAQGVDTPPRIVVDRKIIGSSNLHNPIYMGREGL